MHTWSVRSAKPNESVRTWWCTVSKMGGGGEGRGQGRAAESADCVLKVHTWRCPFHVSSKKIKQKVDRGDR